MSDEMQKQIQARIQKMNQKTFILNFDQKTSTYKEDVQLDAPKSQIGGAGVMVMSFGGSGNGSIYFKNINEKRFVNQTEIMGKRFLVKDSLPNYQWDLSTETKNIGNYTCYKATFTRTVEDIQMVFEDGESKENKIKKTVTTTAWYTPQVPVSNGPDNYQGLPGLILEINDGERLIVCTEIVLNPSEKIEVKAPEKGEIVSQAAYDKIQEEKTQELMERFKSRNGVNMGGGINIKIGG
jgi:GLPGLI family protein